MVWPVLNGGACPAVTNTDVVVEVVVTGMVVVVVVGTDVVVVVVVGTDVVVVGMVVVVVVVGTDVVVTGMVVVVVVTGDALDFRMSGILSPLVSLLKLSPLKLYTPAGKIPPMVASGNDPLQLSTVTGGIMALKLMPSKNLLRFKVSCLDPSINVVAPAMEFLKSLRLALALSI